MRIGLCARRGSSTTTTSSVTRRWAGLLDLGPPGDVLEERPLGPLAEAVAEDPERPRGIAKAARRLGRGESLDEVGAQCLVLPLPWMLRLHEEAGFGR